MQDPPPPTSVSLYFAVRILIPPSCVYKKANASYRGSVNSHVNLNLPQTVPGPEVREVLSELCERLIHLLGDELVGLYAYGSLAVGDFDLGHSDIDLLAALASEIEEGEFAALKELHAQLVRDHPDWKNRIEVAYVTTRGLRTFKSRPSKVAIISPGEPLHLKEVGRDWLIDYYIVQEYGLTLCGPAGGTLIESISSDEFKRAVLEYLDRQRDSLSTSPTLGAQNYAVLTTCRGLYALGCGEHTSKKEAALWAQRQFPEWASVIQLALSSANHEPPSKPDYQETRRFLEWALDAAHRQLPLPPPGPRRSRTPSS